MTSPRTLILAALLMTAAAGCAGVGAEPDASVGPMPSDGPVGRTFEGASEKFARCGRDSISVQTGTVQNLELLFTVGAGGSVEAARIERMDGPDPDLHGCVLRVLKKLRFPKPRDGKPKTVKYPLVIRSE